MKQELIKIKTSDDIELVGMLYTPINTTKKVVVHVHGFAGNFYENSFLDNQAKSYTDKGYAFFSFNNRGNGYITDLVKNENGVVTYVDGGVAYEMFKDSYLDIDAAINYVNSLGFDEIILQGHSYGCNKAINYYADSKTSLIKKIILLAPCDIIGDLGSDSEFENYIRICREKTNNSMGGDIVISKLFPPIAFCAKAVVSNFLESGPVDIFRYRSKNFINNELNKVEIPVLILIGTIDKTALTEDTNIIENYLKNNIKKSELVFIEGANHGYIGKEKEMSEACVMFLEKL